MNRIVVCSYAIYLVYFCYLEKCLKYLKSFMNLYFLVNIGQRLFFSTSRFGFYNAIIVPKMKFPINPLNANPEKWSNTLKQIVGNLPTICLSMFDHFMNLALKGLRILFSFIIIFIYFNIGSSSNVQFL